MRYILFCFLLISSVLVESAYAGVVLGNTRVVYDAAKKEAQLVIYNKDNNYYLIQSWIENPTKPGAKSPFIITPPVLKLSPQKNSSIRIVAVDTLALPTDRESLFILNVKAIPAIDKKIDNFLLLSNQNVLKLIYRPNEVSPSNYQKSLKAIKEGGELYLVNDSANIVSIMALKVDNVNEKVADTLLPYERIKLLKRKAPQRIEVSIINDYGVTVLLEPIKIN